MSGGRAVAETSLMHLIGLADGGERERGDGNGQSPGCPAPECRRSGSRSVEGRCKTVAAINNGNRLEGRDNSCVKPTWPVFSLQLSMLGAEQT